MGAVAGPGRGALTLGMSAAVAAISSATLFILLAEPLDSTVIAAGRVAVTGVALTIVARTTAAVPWRTAAADREVAGRLALSAVLLALHFGTWIASLTMTSVVRSVTLVATQPLWAALMGRLLGDRAHASIYVAGAIAAAGTAVMFSGEASGVALNWGDALALVAAAAAAGYLSVGRSLRDRLPLSAYLGAVHLVAAACLVGVVWATGIVVWPATAEPSDALAVLYLGLVPGLVGHGLLNWAVRHAPVHLVSLAIVAEPVGAAALAVAVVGTPLSGAEVLGGGIVLIGVAVGVVGGR